MSLFPRWRVMVTAATLLFGTLPELLACTACFGQQTDSPMASGMNWGIVSLLGVILGVLSGFSLVFFLLIRKSGSPLAFGEPGGPELVSPPKRT